MKVKLEEWAYMPERAHTTDAGADLRTPHDVIVPAKGSVVIDTGVHIELPTIYLNTGLFPEKFLTVGFLKSKSGLNVKHGITSEGVIDVGYTGSIAVKLYNHSDKPYELKAGDKISQLVVMPILTPSFELVEELEATERGNGGFGSTGR